MAGKRPAVAGGSWTIQSVAVRARDAAEIAQVIVFLASEGASYMTGAIVDVNGGALMP